MLEIGFARKSWNIKQSVCAPAFLYSSSRLMVVHHVSRIKKYSKNNFPLYAWFIFSKWQKKEKSQVYFISYYFPQKKIIPVQLENAHV